MDVETKITITLSDTDLKEIVSEYLIRKGYQVPPENVSFVAVNEWVGYGLSEHQETRFKGCTAVVMGG